MHIFTEYAAGKKVTDIAQELNQRGIRYRGNFFLPTTIYYILRQEKYTGIYRVNNIAYDQIYPQIVPLDVYEIVRAKIEKNKYDKAAKQNHAYLLKGKIFCGCCGARMNAFGGTSKPGKLYRYYRCPKAPICTQRKSVHKGILESGISTAFRKVLFIEQNVQMLVHAIIDRYNTDLYDVTALRTAEKELAKIHLSITNLFKAVENGFYSDSTNSRIQELERRKAELTEFITTEKTKEVEPLTEEQVLEYLAIAKTKDMQTVIDMLVRKVIVQNDLIHVYLKYDILSPKDDNPKHIKDPTQILSERGLLLFSHSHPYFLSPNGKIYLEFIPNKELARKEFVVNIFI